MTAELGLILAAAAFFVIALTVAMGAPLYYFSKQDLENDLNNQ